MVVLVVLVEVVVVVVVSFLFFSWHWWWCFDVAAHSALLGVQERHFVGGSLLMCLVVRLDGMGWWG